MSRNNDPLYKLWKSIKGRCYNPNKQNYYLYGGRGIRVADEWLNDPMAFVEYVRTTIGDRPEGCSLDRIDNDGHYEPNNLRWATKEQQAQNKRTTRMLTHQGETLCLTEWATRLGITHSALIRRIKLWGVEKALSKSKYETRRRFLTYKGQTRSMIEWAQLVGISLEGLHYRIDKGWSIKRAFAFGVAAKSSTWV